MTKKEENADITYEQAALELESIVSMIASGDLPLEESIKVFEKGIKLVRICNKKLDDIEKRITLLIEGKDGIIEKDFNPDDL